MSIGKLLATLQDPGKNSVNRDFFGIAMAVSGPIAVIGAPDPGSFADVGVAYIFIPGQRSRPQLGQPRGSSWRALATHHRQALFAISTQRKVETLRLPVR